MTGESLGEVVEDTDMGMVVASTGATKGQAGYCSLVVWAWWQLKSWQKVGTALSILADTNTRHCFQRGCGDIVRVDGGGGMQDQKPRSNANCTDFGG